MDVLRPFEPFEIAAAFFLQIAPVRPGRTRCPRADSRQSVRDLPRGAGQSVMSISSSDSRLRCVATSKRRIDSISSPKSSMRTGSCQSGAKISTNAAPRGKLARQFHGAGRCESRSSTSHRSSRVRFQGLAAAQLRAASAGLRGPAPACSRLCTLVAISRGRSACPAEGASNRLSSRSRSP